MAIEFDGKSVKYIDEYEWLYDTKKDIFKNRIYTALIIENNNFRHLSPTFRALTHSLYLSTFCLIDIYQMSVFVHEFDTVKDISIINQFIPQYSKIVYPRVFNDKKYELILTSIKKPGKKKLWYNDIIKKK